MMMLIFVSALCVSAVGLATDPLGHPPGRVMPRFVPAKVVVEAHFEAPLELGVRHLPDPGLFEQQVAKVVADGVLPGVTPLARRPKGHSGRELVEDGPASGLVRGRARLLAIGLESLGQDVDLHAGLFPGPISEEEAAPERGANLY